MNNENQYSTRQNKVARLIQKELGDYFQREAGLHFSGKMITVTVVRITPDLSQAKVYLSIFPPEARDQVMEQVEESARSIRMELGKKIRNQVRIIPELLFHVDDSMDYFEKIDNLLKK